MLDWVCVTCCSFADAKPLDEPRNLKPHHMRQWKNKGECWTWVCQDDWNLMEWQWTHTDLLKMERRGEEWGWGNATPRCHYGSKHTSLGLHRHQPVCFLKCVYECVCVFSSQFHFFRFAMFHWNCLSLFVYLYIVCLYFFLYNIFFTFILQHNETVVLECPVNDKHVNVQYTFLQLVMLHRGRACKSKLRVNICSLNKQITSQTDFINVCISFLGACVVFLLKF